MPLPLIVLIQLSFSALTKRKSTIVIFTNFLQLARQLTVYLRTIIKWLR
ncbi:hypothetical protein HMPREF9103_03138 [Lentilactobacillus parafarraginis F0439]|uniref:Uncharacterized protein n=1 Tax=Lentilactobacillus parafarraginis F0439 TaxID=797515 RepID=G9ZTQ4_9LACO|nr:hypothetical protein HMPREF9103_03138 [Lentilactobacillus parafarraginis F0439]